MHPRTWVGGGARRASGGRGRRERSERSSSEGSDTCRHMQHRAGEVPGEEEVGAAAHHQDRLGQRGPVQGQEVCLLRYLHIQGAVHLHPEGVPGGEVIVMNAPNHRKM